MILFLPSFEIILYVISYIYCRGNKPLVVHLSSYYRQWYCQFKETSKDEWLVSVSHEEEVLSAAAAITAATTVAESDTDKM